MNDIFFFVIISSFFISYIFKKLSDYFKLYELLIILPLFFSAIAFYQSLFRILILIVIFSTIIRLKNKLPLFIYLFLEIGFYIFCHFMGFKISFLGWGENFIYLNGFSILITVIWMFTLIRIFTFLSAIKGLIPAMLLVFGVLVFLVSKEQQSSLELAKILNSIVLGISLHSVLNLFTKSNSKLNPLQSKLLGFLTAIISITGVSKRILLVSFVFPTLFVLLPLFFIGSFIFYYYLRENLNDLKASSTYRILWQFTNKRALVIIYFIFLYVTIWLFTFLANISPTDKLIIVIISTIAIIILVLTIILKIEEHHNELSVSNVLGIPISNLTERDLMCKIENMLNKNRKIFITTPNAIAFIKARKSKDFLNVLKNADFNIPDGAGVVWASDVLGVPVKQRLTGVDFMLKLLSLAENNNLSVYFLGTTQNNLKLLVENISKKYPDLRIAGYRNGFFDEKDKNSIIEDINKKNTDLLFVALGMPKQELFIYENLNILNIKLAIGVGGAFDIYAGKSKRAPLIFQKMGFEWLFRFINEPKRIINMLSLIWFIIIVLKSSIQNAEYN